MKFRGNMFARARDIHFSVSSRIMNRKWTVKHTKSVSFWTQTLTLITNNVVFFKLELHQKYLKKGIQNLQTFVCNFELKTLKQLPIQNLSFF